jgi:hypothetical protein
MSIEKPLRIKRTHSKAFKTELVKACREPGVSVSGIAMANGVHPNLLRKWMRMSKGSVPDRDARVAVATPTGMGSGGFVPVSIEPLREAIRIEARRGDAVVKVEWPVSAAGECAAWLRDWLK